MMDLERFFLDEMEQSTHNLKRVTKNMRDKLEHISSPPSPVSTPSLLNVFQLVSVLGVFVHRG